MWFYLTFKRKTNLLLNLLCVFISTVKCTFTNNIIQGWVCKPDAAIFFIKFAVTSHIVLFIRASIIYFDKGPICVWLSDTAIAETLVLPVRYFLTDFQKGGGY